MFFLGHFSVLVLAFFARTQSSERRLFGISDHTFICPIVNIAVLSGRPKDGSGRYSKELRETESRNVLTPARCKAKVALGRFY